MARCKSLSSPSSLVFYSLLVTVFKPDMILTDNQMVEYKKAERKYFLEKKGAVKDPDEPAEMNRASRRAKSLKGKRRCEELSSEFSKICTCE